MSSIAPTEELVEDVGIGLLQSLGVPSWRGQQVDEAGERAGAAAYLLHGRLAAAVQRHDPQLLTATADAVVASLSHPPYPTLIENNRWFHDLLTNGIPVEYKDPKRIQIRARCAAAGRS